MEKLKSYVDVFNQIVAVNENSNATEIASVISSTVDKDDWQYFWIIIINVAYKRLPYFQKFVDIAYNLIISEFFNPETLLFGINLGAYYFKRRLYDLGVFSLKDIKLACIIDKSMIDFFPLITITDRYTSFSKERLDEEEERAKNFFSHNTIGRFIIDDDIDHLAVYPIESLSKEKFHLEFGYFNTCLDLALAFNSQKVVKYLLQFNDFRKNITERFWALPYAPKKPSYVKTTNSSYINNYNTSFFDKKMKLESFQKDSSIVFMSTNLDIIYTFLESDDPLPKHFTQKIDKKCFLFDLLPLYEELKSRGYKTTPEIQVRYGNNRIFESMYKSKDQYICMDSVVSESIINNNFEIFERFHTYSSIKCIMEAVIFPGNLRIFRFCAENRKEEFDTDYVIQVAVSRKAVDILEYIFTCKDIKLDRNKMVAALEYATQFNSRPVVELILRMNPSLAKKRFQNSTYLTRAVKRMDVEMVRSFVDNGANVVKCPREGVPLHYFALRNDDPETLKILMDGGAEVDFDMRSSGLVVKFSPWNCFDAFIK